jgi:hypothetical protein
MYVENPNEWTIDQVYHWAMEKVFLLREDANILKQQKVDGKTLLALTKDKLLKEPYKMPFGSATKLASAIKTLRNEWAKRIACMRNKQTNTQANKHICHIIYDVNFISIYVEILIFYCLF